EILRHCPDIARALTRLTLGRGGPRDLAALRETLCETAGLRRLLGNTSPAHPSPQPGGRGFVRDVGEDPPSPIQSSPSPLAGPSPIARGGGGGGLPPPFPILLRDALRDLGEHGALVDRLTRALGPELPLLTRDGGFIAEAYSAELDEL